MKMLFTSMDRIDVGVLGSIIEEAGIAFDVRNDATSANYPTGPFFPELWIIHDEDIVKAVELRDAWRATPSAELTPWTCPGCGEELEAQFGSCWKCGVIRDEDDK